MNHYTALDDQICQTWRYPGGEVGVRATAPLAAPRDLLARIQDSDALVRVLMYLAAAPGMVRRVCVPYLPYARQDRIAVPGDPIAIEVFARLLATTDVRDFATIDAHSPAAAEAFAAAGCRLENLPSTTWLAGYLAALRLAPDRPVWFVAPDHGARTRTAAHARSLSRPDQPIGVVHCTKVRDPITGKLQRFEVDLDDSPTALASDVVLVVVDDICDGGGTFHGIADALARCYGTQDLHLWTTHGIYSRGLDDLARTFTTLGSTDSFLHGHTHERLITIPLQPMEAGHAGAKDQHQ